MSKTYQIHVFGKPGCDKCHTLNGRLDDLLQEAEWADFEKIYHDLVAYTNDVVRPKLTGLKFTDCIVRQRA